MEQVSQLVYQGQRFRVEFYVDDYGECPAEYWMAMQPPSIREKFAALFVRLADVGMIFIGRKFKHLTNTDQIFEFKIRPWRAMSFFISGRRIILTHGFYKKGKKIPKTEIRRAEGYKKIFLRRYQ